MDIINGKTEILNSIKAFHSTGAELHGQLALRLDNDYYIGTSENLPLSAITEDDILVYNIGTGDLGMVFFDRPDINSIVTIVNEDIIKSSMLKKSLIASLDDVAEIVGYKIPVAKQATAAKILSAIKQADACLINRQGILGVGKNMQQAASHALIIKKNCDVSAHSQILGGVKTLKKSDANNLRSNYFARNQINNKDEYINFIGFDESEFKLRTQIIEAGKAMLRNNLSYGSLGNISARINSQEMLITPSRMNYFEINPEDIVRVNINTLEYGEQRKPSSETMLHAKMYRDIEDCEAIVHTHSTGLATFAACEAGFTINEEELSKLIGDLKVIDYAPSGSEELTLNAIEILKETHAAILSHHGAIFHGPSLDVVMAIANALEDRACNIIGL